MAFCVKPGGETQTNLIVTNQKQRRRTNYHQEPPEEQHTNQEQHEPTRRRNTPATTTPPGAKKRTEQHNHDNQPETADQPKHTRTNTDRRNTTQHTPTTHHTHEATAHPTHHETRRTHHRHETPETNRTTTPKQQQKQQKIHSYLKKHHADAPGGTEKHQVQPHRRCKCDTHNSGGGTTQRDTAPKAGRGHKTTQTTANKLQNTQQKHRKSNDKANFLKPNLR